MEYTCKICGRIEDDSKWLKDTAKEMSEHQMCFECNFWRSQNELDLKERNKYGYAIVDGTHYTLLPKTDSYFKGHGGRYFSIMFNDGTVKDCENLWCQGDIPEGHWKELMPNNAVFIQKIEEE